MRHPALFKTILQLSQKLATTKHKQTSNRNAGYTLIEMLAVVIIIGVLSAMAAPGWLSFIQQRRVSTAVETLSRAVQEAQTKAKSTKRYHGVALKMSANGVPQIAAYQIPDPYDATPTPPPANSPLWKGLNEGQDINAGEIWFATNAQSNNKVRGNNEIQAVSKTAAVNVLTFDHTGALAITPQAPELGNEGLIIAVAADGTPNDENNNSPIPGTGRCVKISTVLGSMEIGRTERNPATSPAKCNVRR